jgi:excisionase family DNA binding protein
VYHRSVMVAEVAQVDDEVLDVRETAVLLGLPEEVVINEAAKGNLPGRRIGGQWRFSHAGVLAWLRAADAGTDDTQARSRQPGGGQQDVDRLLAAQPAEPPTPAEQASRDDNDALGEP